MDAVRAALRVILTPTNLKRTGLIAVLVGVWLTGVNEGGQLIHGELGGQVGLKMAMNFMTPFVVANLGLIAQRDPTAGGEPEPRQPGTGRDSAEADGVTTSNPL